MSEPERERDIRLSQTVAPFGVGAIYDYRGESLIAMDITAWRDGGNRVLLDRLARDLDVREFRSAPTLGGDASIGTRLPFLRFPRWLFCPTCRKLIRWKSTMEVPGRPARCTSCPEHPQLVPMRFVVVCEDGHLSDVWWGRWAHAGAKADGQKQCRQEEETLEFLSTAEAGVGLGALSVRCTTCGSEETLEGITSGAPHPGIRCSGRQPWERLDVPATCPRTPHVVQRGASNLYFAEVRSAIDIPPDSDHDAHGDLALELSNARDFELLREAPPENKTLVKLLKFQMADRQNVDQGRLDEILAAEAEAAAAGSAARPTSGTGDLLRDEWEALRAERHDQDVRSHFVTRREPLVVGDGDGAGDVQAALAQRLQDVVLVTRLREVRVLKSFRRHSPEGAEIRPALGASCDWLPAIEVFGEGVFLSFEEGPLQAWERRPPVLDRVKDLEGRREGSFVGRRVEAASPRFILLHTFAHLLIRRLSFECGYTAASLRERIYCAEAGEEREPFAGVLISTAAGDAEGTLGGLVRQGRPPHMVQTILAMLQDAAWCSSDPICIESRGQGFEGLNRGACHACTLLAETSCEYSNALLDRAVVVGADGVGFFGDVLEAALNATDSES